LDNQESRPSIETLHARLCERLAELHPPIVGEVMRHFLEVSSLECELMLWSLEFAFDEDDARVARIEARFVGRDDPNPFREDLPGYAVHVGLPRLIPSLPRAEREGTSSDAAGEPRPVEPAAHAGPAFATGADDRTLVARFLRVLADMGAYRTIEPLAARAADVHLL